MPFKASEAKTKINRLSPKYTFNGQSLDVKYNAGDKYAALEEEVERQGLDAIGEDDDNNPSIADLRLKLANLLCMVIEEWDYETEDGKILPIDGQKLADEHLPLEFYSGLSTAISEDYANRGGGNKSRS